MFTQNFIKLSAAVHELSCTQRKKLQRKQYSSSLPADSKDQHKAVISSELQPHRVGQKMHFKFRQTRCVQLQCRIVKIITSQLEVVNMQAASPSDR